MLRSEALSYNVLNYKREDHADALTWRSVGQLSYLSASLFPCATQSQAIYSGLAIIIDKALEEWPVVQVTAKARVKLSGASPNRYLEEMVLL